VFCTVFEPCRFLFKVDSNQLMFEEDFDVGHCVQVVDQSSV
jgi:hypothetical protein